MHDDPEFTATGFVFPTLLPISGLTQELEPDVKVKAADALEIARKLAESKLHNK